MVALEALLIVLLLPFGFLFTGTLVFHQAHLVTIGVVGAVGWVSVIRRPGELSWMVVAAPLPLFGAAVLTALASPYPSLSWTAVWQIAAYAGIFWLLALQASGPAGRRELLDALSIVLIIVIGMYLLAAFTAWREWLALGFDISTLPLRPLDTGGLALLPTWLADLVALLTPVVAALLWERRARVAAIVLVAVAFVTILVTETRSVLLLVLAVCTIAALLIARARSGRKGIGIVIGGAIVISVVGVIVVLGSGRSFDEGRSSAYSSAISRFTESPLVGGGPGSYGVRRMSDPVDTLGLLTFPDAHNVILTAAAESGIVGLAALLLTAALLVLAIRRSWAFSTDRTVVIGALVGLAILVGHSMVDVVIGLVGLVVSALAVAAIAVTSANGLPRPTVVMPALRYGLVGLAIVAVAATTLGIRTEVSYAAIAEIDRTLVADPSAALSRLTPLTGDLPDVVPVWWAQMIAADAAGRPDVARGAAETMVDLEGFTQQWMQLAVLASRAGDDASARESIGRATDGPINDPLVQLNAAVLLGAMGDDAGARAAATRLLQSQPDIEPVLRDGPAALSAIVASLRSEQAHLALDAGEIDRAFLLALNGEDRGLADSLLATVDKDYPASATDLRDLVDAWFGSDAAKVRLEGKATQDPSIWRLSWAWRIAARACDTLANDRWARALQIAGGPDATMPTTFGVAPDLRGRLLPARYPTFVWRLEYPVTRYVDGTWAWTLGSSRCAAAAGG